MALFLIQGRRARGNLYNNDKVVGLDIAKINELERELNKVSHFTDYDYRSEGVL